MWAHRTAQATQRALLPASLVPSPRRACVPTHLCACRHAPQAARGLACTSCALTYAHNVIKTNMAFYGREALPTIVLVTASRQAAGGTDALAMDVAEGIKSSGFTILTVGVGEDAPVDVLSDIATQPSIEFSQVGAARQPAPPPQQPPGSPSAPHAAA